MISRDEVLHVAALARLELREDQIEPMARELSSVLGHIERMNELDLDAVEPTSHVVAVAGGLRSDEVRPSLERDVALAQAPQADGEGFLVPSPQA